MKSSKFQAFTLIELIIVLAMIAILTTYAVSQYNRYVVKTRRLDAKIALYDLAQKLEQHYGQQHTYLGVKLAVNPSGENTFNQYSPQGFYQLSLVKLTLHEFRLQATPLGTQAQNDKVCQSLQLNHLGEQAITGPGTAKTCW
ncbi:MAG: type IV pilin protein [Pseudomonadota bacterium]